MKLLKYHIFFCLLQKLFSIFILFPPIQAAKSKVLVCCTSFSIGLHSQGFVQQDISYFLVIFSTAAFLSST